MMFEATVQDGKPVVAALEKLKKYLCGLEGKRIEVSIEPRTRPRSLSQNAYYWAYLRIISDETGDDENSLHEYLKRLLLPPKFMHVHLSGTEVEVKVPASTSDLSKSDFAEYLERICATTGVPLPDPRDLGYVVENPGLYNLRTRA